MQVPLLPRLSHGTLLLLSVVPVPHDTEHDDQVLQGSDTGRGAADGDLCSLVDFCRTKKTYLRQKFTSLVLLFLKSQKIVYLLNCAARMIHWNQALL